MKTILIYTHNKSEYDVFNCPPFSKRNNVHDEEQLVKVLDLGNDRKIFVVFFNDETRHTILVNNVFDEHTEMLIFYHGGEPTINFNFLNIQKISHSTQNRTDRQNYEILQNSIDLDTDFDTVWDIYDQKGKDSAILEAKLELLHQCLTPEGLEKVNWIGELVTIENENNEPNQKTISSKYTINNASAEKLFVTLKNTAFDENGKSKNIKAFDPIYIKALEDLRDALLED